LKPLTKEEILLGSISGCIRRANHVTQRDAVQYELNRWEMDIEGVLAEMWLAKQLNVYPTGWAGVRAPDVSGWEVRHTSREDGSLIIQKNDADHLPFALVIGANGKYRCAGWLYGREAKQDKFWRGELKRPAYFVPQPQLHRMEGMQ